MQIITHQEELESITENLSNVSRIAADLEFDKNYYRYGFNLCLVQLFDGENCYLVDPLSDDLNIKSIFPVLEDPEIEIITFAFGEDLRLLHSLGCFPKNIYDIDIATSLLNYEPGSLTKLLDEAIDVDTGKSSQTSNWFQRPLTDQQKKYAAHDVLHLFDLKDKLDREVKEKGIENWLAGEKKSWEEDDFSDISNNQIIREKDKNDLSEVEWHIFKALMEYWDEKAQEINRPLFKVIKKDLLQQIAAKPRTLGRWHRTRGIHRKFKSDEIKEELQDLIRNAKAEALEIGLSESEPAYKPLPQDKKQEIRQHKQLVSRAKDEFFNPIKKAIEDDFGKETATFLFSNRIIDEIVSNRGSNLEGYKKEILKNYSDQLNLKPDPYIDNI